MRLQLLLASLPLLALADNSPPYQRLFDKVKDFIPSSFPDPVDAGAAKVAGQIVERITIRNFNRKLSPKLDGEEEWMVYFTGGNKSCFGRCEPVDQVWNV
jgi:PTH2 family peptidyl-tRNA hydrolase